MENKVQNGDIAIMHDWNWNYTERVGTPHKFLILWKGTNRQPLCLKYEDVEKGVFLPAWETYDNITEIVGHIDLAELFSKSIESLQ